MNLKDLENQLIVSCQALPDEPLHSPMIMGRMARAAKQGGAGGIRANTVVDINEIKKIVDLPVIGIIKRDYSDSDVYITPTLKEIKELVENTKAEIIAFDATNRVKPENCSTKEMVDYIHRNGRLAMADISNYEEGIEAEKCGFDLISTTMSGYTEYTPKIDQPDFNLIKRLSNVLKIPVIMEGHTSSPLDVKKGFEQGAFAAVVGGAITRPQQITKFYVENMN